MFITGCEEATVATATLEGRLQGPRKLELLQGVIQTLTEYLTTTQFTAATSFRVLSSLLHPHHGPEGGRLHASAWLWLLCLVNCSEVLILNLLPVRRSKHYLCAMVGIIVSTIILCSIEMWSCEMKFHSGHCCTVEQIMKTPARSLQLLWFGAETVCLSGLLLFPQKQNKAFVHLKQLS